MRNKINISLLLISFSLFLYQVCLLRIFSIADYYHFAFMIVSISLLGFGISGSFLYFFIGKLKNPDLILLIFSFGFSVSIITSFLVSNFIPFDSFKIAWEIRHKIDETGSIIVYYESFERGVLKELAEAFPDYSQWIDSILTRIVDLYKPFGNFHYYHSSQKGSASVKNVLPAITGLSYEGMEIADGMAASVYFLYICGNYGINESRPAKEEVEKVRKSLIKYCGMDTGGMIHILRALVKEVK